MDPSDPKSGSIGQSIRLYGPLYRNVRFPARRHRSQLRGTRRHRTGNLNWWTRHRTVGAKYAAVSRARPQYDAAASACVDDLTGVDRHPHHSCHVAMRTRDHGIQNDAIAVVSLLGTGWTNKPHVGGPGLFMSTITKYRGHGGKTALPFTITTNYPVHI